MCCLVRFEQLGILVLKLVQLSQLRFHFHGEILQHWFGLRNAFILLGGSLDVNISLLLFDILLNLLILLTTICGLGLGLRCCYAARCSTLVVADGKFGGIRALAGGDRRGVSLPRGEPGRRAILWLQPPACRRTTNLLLCFCLSRLLFLDAIVYGTLYALSMVSTCSVMDAWLTCIEVIQFED